MSSSLNIYPFESTEGAIRFVVQVAIFLVGLFLANKLIIGPALKLHNERLKRTSGSNEQAKKELEAADQLEAEYLQGMKKGIENAKHARTAHIQATQAEANKLVAQTQDKANVLLNNVKDQIHSEAAIAKEQLPAHLNEILAAIRSKMGFSALLFTAFLAGFMHPSAHAQETELIQSFWYSVFWPYFQFAVFIVAIVYFAKKPIENMLAGRREELRSRLSEAHEAVELANRKLLEYKKKISALQGEIEQFRTQQLQDAKIESARILEEARKASENLLKDSERTAKELIAQSQEKIKKELFSIALSEFEKRLTPESLKTLSVKFKEETLNKIEEIH